MFRYSFVCTSSGVGTCQTRACGHNLKVYDRSRSDRAWPKAVLGVGARGGCPLPPGSSGWYPRKIFGVLHCCRLHLVDFNQPKCVFLRSIRWQNRYNLIYVCHATSDANKVIISIESKLPTDWAKWSFEIIVLATLDDNNMCCWSHPIISNDRLYRMKKGSISARNIA